MIEYFLSMGRIGKFTCQVLPGEVQVLVQVKPPFWAVRYIIYDAIAGDKFTCAPFPCAPL